MMHFKRFDPGTCKLAAPKVSALPTLSLRSLTGYGAELDSAIRRQLAYTRSRYALTDAYRLCGVGIAGALLAPAYHCRTMLDPALRLGAECRLYSLEADLTLNVAVIDRMLSEAGGQVRAVLATHFFGFVQDFQALADCCRGHGVHLIEDCSHLLPTLGSGARLGALGSYSVWSPYKFYPCEDGGYLQTNGDAPAPLGGLTRQSPWTEVKGMLRLLRRSRKTVNGQSIDALAEQLASNPNGSIDRGVDIDEPNGAHSRDYLPQQERMAMSQVSRWLVRHADADRIKRGRRQRYQQWMKAVSSWPHCRPLHAVLPDDCVPYMFPLYMHCPAAHFMPIKRIGVPVWRWDSMAISDCPVANDYRLRLFQMPCHQELNDAEMNWMIEAVSIVVAGSTV